MSIDVNHHTPGTQGAMLLSAREWFMGKAKAYLAGSFCQQQSNSYSTPPVSTIADTQGLNTEREVQQLGLPY